MHVMVILTRQQFSVREEVKLLCRMRGNKIILKESYKFLPSNHLGRLNSLKKSCRVVPDCSHIRQLSNKHQCYGKVNILLDSNLTKKMHFLNELPLTLSLLKHLLKLIFDIYLNN